MTNTERFPPEEQAAFEASRLKDGELYTFDRIAKIANAPVDSNVVNIVRNKMLGILRERGINLKPVKGVGYIRLSERERVKRQARLGIAKVRRQLLRTAKDLFTIDTRVLTSGEILELSKQQGRVGALRSFIALRKPQEYEVSKIPKLPRVPKLGDG